MLSFERENAAAQLVCPETVAAIRTTHNRASGENADPYTP